MGENVMRKKFDDLSNPDHDAAGDKYMLETLYRQIAEEGLEPSKAFPAHAGQV
jgi:hypothetical protein